MDPRLQRLLSRRWPLRSFRSDLQSQISLKITQERWTMNLDYTDPYRGIGVRASRTVISVAEAGEKPPDGCGQFIIQQQRGIQPINSTSEARGKPPMQPKPYSAAEGHRNALQMSILYLLLSDDFCSGRICGPVCSLVVCIVFAWIILLQCVTRRSRGLVVGHSRGRS